MDPRELGRKEFESLDGFLARFDFSLQEVQAEVFSQIIATIQSFPQDGRKFVVNEKSIQIILRLEERIQELIRTGKYTREYKSLLKNFDNVEEIRKQMSAFVNPAEKAKVFKAETSAIKKGYVAKIASKLGNAETFGLNVVSPIKDILFEHSTLGLSVPQAAKKLFELTMGPKPGNGKLATYAGQIAHDSLFSFTGSVDKAIGDHIGASDVNYIGNIIKDSRPQCVRWVIDFGGFIPGNKLQAEIDWALENGEGYSDHLPSLTIDTFPVIRGGHNCRHRVVLSAGPASDRIKKLEKAHEKEAKRFNAEAVKELDASTRRLYEKTKEKLNASIGR